MYTCVPPKRTPQVHEAKENSMEIVFTLVVIFGHMNGDLTSSTTIRVDGYPSEEVCLLALDQAAEVMKAPDVTYFTGQCVPFAPVADVEA
jgi:hypothetical protein